MASKKKALFIRLDRIGDLVLSLPCDQLINDSYEAHWFTPEGLDFVVEGSMPRRQHTSFQKDFSFSNFLKAFRVIRKLKPDASISLHTPWWINFALFLNRVPLRGGVLSQWHSYLFLNKGTRQKRSQCEFHELEYNYILVEKTFSLKRNRELWRSLPLKANKDSLKPSFNIHSPYIVVHPGMGGSALNWPNSNYLELMSKLSERVQVVVTGTKSDETYLSPLKESLKENKNVLWLDSQLDGSQLLNVLANAIAVIAPSTGVLHLGASLGAPSFGIYSPVGVHSSNRWGPKGPNAQSFTPKVTCPGQFQCLGKACSNFDCMGSVLAKDVLAQIPLPTA